MKKHLIILLLTLCYSFSYAQNALNKDSLVVDFKFLVKNLEETHPDPYTDFGGKVMFHKKAFDVIQQLKANEISVNEYANIISSFLSNLHDGHTYVSRSKVANKLAMTFLPLSFKVIGDGLLIDKISKENKEYLGAKVLFLNNISVDTIALKITNYIPCENKYGAYYAFNRLTSANQNLLYDLIPNFNNKVSLTVSLAGGQVKNLDIELITDNTWRTSDKYIANPKFDKKSDYLYYNYLDKNKQIMYLKMSSVMSRECFLFMKQNNWANLSSFLDSFYKQLLIKEQPKELDKAIKELPSYSELFYTMLHAMKQDKSTNLIIDLRGNSGGFTDITLPSLYMLYGDEYLNTDMGTLYYTLISPLLLTKRGTTLANFNANNNADYEYGDYTFSDVKAEDATAQQKRDKFVQNTMGDADYYIKNLKGAPIYTPKKVYVLVDAGTFSAAFHYAFYLWKMGAVVVGVPPRQAPNAFMETTGFELPYTNLSGSISNSVQYFLPATDKRAKIFWPDMMLKYDDYKAQNFNQDSELLWLVNYLEKN